MKATAVYSSEGRLNTKAKRQKDFQKNRSTAPETYKVNSTKEELCYEYIRSFTEQFSAIHKNRKAPFMVADNEYGVKKFVCSTVRPTQLPIPELYDLFECASFLAGYIIYEPLDPQTELPKHLFSPTATLDSNTGDSFDLATLLCSLLLGAGYDAYVVCGYAPRFITLRDQSNTKCPIATETSESINSSDRVSTAASSSSGEAKTDTEDESGEEKSSYVPPDNSVKSSKFMLEKAEQKRIAGLDTFQLWIPDPDLDEKAMMEAEKNADAAAHRKRVHAWVYVNAGSREVKESLFIEPTTGRAYNLSLSPYVGVESVWNHHNFWVNLQMDKKVAEMSFDLKSEKLWEQLFLSPSGSAQRGDSGGENNNASHDEEDMMADHHNNQDGQTGAAAVASIDDGVRYFDAPPTWVLPLSLSRSRYLLKYPPNGKRSVQYYCAKADFFSRRVNAQNLVMRITSYLNKECTIVREIHEWYENRSDKMYKRIRYFLGQRRFVEFYHPGSFGAVKKRTEYPGKVIETDFYTNGHPFRLVRREETVGTNVVEYFQGRDDFLTYRHVVLTPDVKVVGTRQLTIPANRVNPELYIVRMTLNYERNPNAPEGTDIAKRIFYIREAKAVFYYHFGKSQITGKIKTYLHTRGPSIPTMSEQALAQEIGLDDDPDLLQEAANLERDIFGYIKTCFAKINETEDNRKQVEKKIVFDQNVFERALDTVDSNNASQYGANSEKQSSSESKGSDYLTAFLRNVSDPAHLTKDEALEIRQACLDALKARLVERANIIQSKLHDENAKLGKKQEHFQRSQREGELSTEEYEKYCTEAMFRIQILQQRLDAHEQSALRKYADLDLKLSNDPRLKVLKN